MTTREGEEEFGDETPLASDQTDVQGQKSLTDLLDEIEQRHARIDCANCGTDVPALVKALRRAMEHIECLCARSAQFDAGDVKSDIAQLLTTGREE